MGADYRYGRDDDEAAGEDPRSYGPSGPADRAYGQAPPPPPGPGYPGPNPGPDPRRGPVPGPIPGPGPGPGASGARSYGAPAPGGPVGPAGPAGPTGGGTGRRGIREPVYGEAVPPPPPPPGNQTRRIPGFDGESPMDTEVGDYRTGLPAPRRSRLEERQEARRRQSGNAASQERSTQYERSPLDGRSTRNGASRPGAGPGGPKRPIRRTGYHRYFDYPRTGKLGWRQWMPSVKQVSSFILGGIFLLIGLVAFEYYTVQIPTDPPLAQASVFQYSDGSTQFATTGTTTRIEVNLDQVPLVVQQAIVSAENKTFWTDPGVSYTGTARALIDDIAGGSDLQGGSTLTQQYVKNTYFNDDKTLSRKVDEIFIALKISHTESKQWILQQYLNTVFFGRDAYGIEAASKAWLGEDIGSVTTPSQAALLASLVNQPTYFSSGFQGVGSDPDAVAALKSRWTYVLGQMVANNNITAAQAASAVFPTPITTGTNTTVTNQQENTNQQMETAADQWLDNWAAANKTTDPNTPTSEEVGAGGYTVITTFNQTDMQLAQDAVTKEFTDKVNPAQGWYNQNLFPGLAAVNPKNGQMIAFYGGTEPYNDATQRQVQPGSTFKAFTLATAYSEGYSENSFMDGTDPWPKKGDPNDAAILAGGPNSYKTVTNDGLSGPSLSFNVATADSVNTAFVRLEQQVGPSKVLQMVNNFGISNANGSAKGLDNSSGLTLGIASVDPARMADAYSTFPDNGLEYPLVEVLEVKEPNGNIWKPNVQPVQVVQPSVAETVTNTLWNVTHLPGATGCGDSYDCATKQADLNNIAGKTGTSTMDFSGIDGDAANLGPDMKYVQEDKDRGYSTAAIWFNGYTSNLEVAVDVSRAVTDSKGQQIPFPVDNIAYGGSDYGATYSLSIWADFMKLMQSNPVVGGDPPFTQPTPNAAALILNSPTATPTPTATAPTTPPGLPTFTPQPCPTDTGFPGNPGGHQCTGEPTAPASPTPTPPFTIPTIPTATPTVRHSKHS